MFYERLKDICRMRGTKLSPLLEKINVSTANTGTWKKGSIPNGETLIKLSEILNVSVDYILGKTDDPLPGEKKEITEDEKALRDMYIMMGNAGIELSKFDTDEIKELIKYAGYLKFSKQNYPAT